MTIQQDPIFEGRNRIDDAVLKQLVVRGGNEAVQTFLRHRDWDGQAPCAIPVIQIGTYNTCNI